MNLHGRSQMRQNGLFMCYLPICLQNDNKYKQNFTCTLYFCYFLDFPLWQFVGGCAAL